ncbi:MFS transporter [Pseudonocardiaceae bacterium YIM PH 21723]|nr:MFS transporter [Pseudonocardiaceae bacterium YIM PH 21723]
MSTIVATPARGMTAGLVTVVIVPQLGMSMIAPGLGTMARDLGVSTAAMQYAMVAFMAGYAVSMLLAGVLSDRFDPVTVELWGLGLFVLGSLACALAPNLSVLVVARFVQALGGCMGTVVTRLVVRRSLAPDRHMGVLATLATAIAITPCLAPLLGAAVLDSLGWRATFAVVAIIGAFAAVLFRLACEPANEGSPVSVDQVLGAYRESLGNRAFLHYAAAIGLAWLSYFIFISCAPSPLQDGLGVDSVHYGLITAGAAAGYVTGTSLARRLATRIGLDRCLRLAGLLGVSGGVLVVVSTLLWPAQPWALAGPVIVVLMGVGAAIPVCQAGLLKIDMSNPGVSSGLFFFLQMISGAVYAGVVNLHPPSGLPGVAVLMLLPMIGLLALGLKASRS